MKRVLLALATLAALLLSCKREDDAGQRSKCPAGAVDLGIVMHRADGTSYKLYWAKSNLSISGLCANPEDYGDYYAWGETEPYYSSRDPLTWKDGKTGYNWSSSRDTDYPFSAYYVFFNSGEVCRYCNVRYDGFSIRPVSE